MLDPTVQQVTESHRKGYIHIHKSDNSYGYCSSFDLIDVKKESSPRFVRRLIREWSGCIRLNINRDLISLENFIGFNRASKKTDSEIILNLSYNSETYDYLNKF